jgi:hypothetical protein
MLCFVTFAPFISFIVRENWAASKYELSDDDQSLVTSCQENSAASFHERDGIISYLRFMHYSISLRGCSCMADRIAASDALDTVTARAIIVGIMPNLRKAEDERLAAAKALADELGLSEANLAEWMGEIGAAYKECFRKNG